MAQIDEKQIEQIVSQVLTTLQKDGAVTVPPVTSGANSSRSGVFTTVEEAIGAAKTAQKALVKLGFAKRREIIEAIKQASLDKRKTTCRLGCSRDKNGQPRT